MREIHNINKCWGGRDTSRAVWVGHKVGAQKEQIQKIIWNERRRKKVASTI